MNNKIIDKISFSDKDYTCYLLSTLKELEKHYCLMMIEASNEWLYQIYRDLLLDVADLERKVYHVLFVNGWYLLETVEVEQLQRKYQLFYEQYNSLIQG